VKEDAERLETGAVLECRIIIDILYNGDENLYKKVIEPAASNLFISSVTSSISYIIEDNHPEPSKLNFRHHFH
jgi:hypothetical protein